MADNSCTGECLRCSMQQQLYCAAQRTFAMMENQRAFSARLENIERQLAGIAGTENIIPLNGAQIAGGAD